MSSLVPGLSLAVTVEFKPSHWRHYTDCIRIHCKNEQNLRIPIHGFVVANLSSFPRNLNFPPVPIGQSCTKCISLKSDVPVDFDYRLISTKSHSAFSVDPVSGIIPQNGEIKFNVTFSPMEFQTATMELQLEVNQYDFVPLVCSVSGTSTPGLTLEQIKQELLLRQYSQQRQPSVHSTQHSSQTPQQFPSVLSSHLSNVHQDNKTSSASLQSSSSPQSKKQCSHTQSLASTSKHSHSARTPQSTGESPSHSPPVEASHPPLSYSVSTQSPVPHDDQSLSEQQDDSCTIRTEKKLVSGRATKRSIKNNELTMVDGFVVPDNLHTHSAVRKLLLQEPGKLKASQLRKVADGGNATIAEGTSRQIKEVGFLKSIEHGVSEEKASQFKWETRLGGSAPSIKEEQAMREQRNSMHKTMAESKSLSENKHVSVLSGKIKRTANQLPEDNIPSFDLCQTNPWASRFFILQRFIQAARKIIIRSRAQSYLDKLARVKYLATSDRSLEEVIDTMYPKELTVKQIESKLNTLPKDYLLFHFPKFDGQIMDGEKQNVFKSSLDQSPMVDKDVALPDLSEDLSYLNLEVLQQSEQLGYGELLTPKVASYIPTGLYKPFLSGAKGEMESLGHIPGVVPAFLIPDPFSSTSTTTSAEDDPKLAQKLEVSITPSPGPAVITLPKPEISKRPSSFSSSERTRPEHDAVQRLFKWRTMPEIELPKTIQDIESEHVSEDEDMNKKAITIPTSMLELPLPSAIQILDPSPEVVDYFTILPNSEADLDHTLLPLPLLQSSKYPIIRLDPVDVIPGLMTWKKFSSPCLSALEKENKLSSCWKPCRTDPFTTAGLLPVETPQNVSMLIGPSEEDKTGVSHPIAMENIQSMFYVPESEDLKDESSAVKKQWSIILQEGLSELEDHHCKSLNTLGDAINSRLDAFIDLNAEMDSYH